jgi:hypothetical protein
LKKLDIVKNEKGEGLIKFLFVIALIVFVIYTGIQFAIPYYKYSAFKSDAKDLANISIGSIEKTKQEIFDRAQELKIPIEEKELLVTKKGNVTRVQTSWSETVNIIGIYEKTLEFVLDVEG